MKIIIYTILTAMALISGIFALTGPTQENEKSTEKSEDIALKSLIGAGTKLAENKANMYSKIIALAMYVVSIASLITLYIIRG